MAASAQSLSRCVAGFIICASSSVLHHPCFIIRVGCCCTFTCVFHLCASPMSCTWMLSVLPKNHPSYCQYWSSTQIHFSDRLLSLLLHLRASFISSATWCVRLYTYPLPAYSCVPLPEEISRGRLYHPDLHIRNFASSSSLPAGYWPRACRVSIVPRR